MTCCSPYDVACVLPTLHSHLVPRCTHIPTRSHSCHPMRFSFLPDFAFADLRCYIYAFCCYVVLRLRCSDVALHVVFVHRTFYTVPRFTRYVTRLPTARCPTVTRYDFWHSLRCPFVTFWVVMLHYRVTTFDIPHGGGTHLTHTLLLPATRW